MDQTNKIKRILSKIRPYIKSHGGEVELVGIKDKIVALEVRGTCTSCPLAKLTYNKVIGGLIKEKIPEIKKVIFKNAK